MLKTRPFRGLTYNPELIGNLDSVVSAYDAIDLELRSKLLSQSPYNVAGILSGDAKSPHTLASINGGGLISSWLQRGILLRADVPSLYVLHQSFNVDGQTYTRKGFLSAVRLDPTRGRSIFPHERTFAEPTFAKFNNLRETKISTSAIFGLYRDANNKIQSLLEESIDGTRPIATAQDHLGNINSLWSVSDAIVIRRIECLMNTKRAVIADGHHRYEAALRYQRWLAKKEGVLSTDHPANFAMMCLVNADDPGLIVFPTHRLISGLPKFSSHDLFASLNEYFTITSFGTGREAGERVWAKMRDSKDPLQVGVGTPLDKEWHLLQSRSRNQYMSPHDTILEKIRDHTSCVKVDYIHDRRAATEGPYLSSLSILVSPPKVHQVLQVAGTGDFMPQKSTFFYPKMLSGLLMHSLNEEVGMKNRRHSHAVVH